MIALWMLIGSITAPPALPSFTFRDWHASDPYIPDDPRFGRCEAIAANSGAGRACALADNRIAGVVARQIGVAFGANGLFALEAKFPSDKAQVVEAALRLRYGSPCQVRTESPRHLMTGAALRRLIRVWCFKDGRATFQSITERRSEASFEFATHDAPKQAAAVDF